MDLLILVLLMVIVILILRRVDSFIYFLGIFDILLRLLTFIKLQITNTEVYNFLNQYVPASIPAIINKYSTGLINTTLIWAYFFCIVLFEIYLIKALLKKK